MTDLQAAVLGKALCDKLPIREEVPGVICTDSGDKTYAGLGHMVNKMAKHVKNG
jgi:CRISPR/Cas system-associated protein Csm6